MKSSDVEMMEFWDILQKPITQWMFNDPVVWSLEELEKLHQLFGPFKSPRMVFLRMVIIEEIRFRNRAAIAELERLASERAVERVINYSPIVAWIRAKIGFS